MSAPMATGDRLRRLLAMLTWLAQVGEAPIEVVADRFGLTPTSLVAELEMAACCGVPPYSPDQLMEILVTDTTVATRPGVALARPRRLSASEGFALAVSARALLAVDGSDEGGDLSRALDKLDEALGGKAIAVELDAPPMLPVVRWALEGDLPLTITYYSASSDRLGERRIRPRRLFAAQGHWYVDAECSTAGGLRRFRIDRITAAEPAAPGQQDRPRVPDPATAHGAEEERAPEGTGLEVFVPGPESARVRLSVHPSAAWLLESVAAVEPPVTIAGRVEVELFVGGTAWLERLLLRLGRHAVVLDPPEFRILAAEAAARILLRYR